MVVPCCEPLALLLLHEELHHEDLLLVDLEADVLGDVWDQPVHKVTHEHHHVLKDNNEGEAGCQNSPKLLGEFIWCAGPGRLSVVFIPAYFYLVAQVHWLERVCAWLKVTDIEVRQSVIDEAVHGAVRAVHVLVDEPWDEVGGEGNDKGINDDCYLAEAS